MKKIVFVIIATILLLFPMAVAFAEVSESPDAENGDGENGTEDAPSENHTVPSRLWDAFSNHHEVVISISGYILLFIASKYNEKKAKDRNGSQNLLLNSIAQNTAVTSGNQSEVTNGFNVMVEGFNSFLKSSGDLTCAYTEMKLTEDANNVRLACLEKQVGTMLDILTTAYSGNKNLPQGLKDIISLKYADCLKTTRLLESGETVSEKPVSALTEGGEAGD